MINSKSVIDGFEIVLGSMPVQFGMLVALLVSISVPRNTETGDYCWDAFRAKALLITMHLVILITKFIQQYIKSTHALLAKAMIMCCLFL